MGTNGGKIKFRSLESLNSLTLIRLGILRVGFSGGGGGGGQFNPSLIFQEELI